MKKTIFTFLILLSLFILSCSNSPADCGGTGNGGQENGNPQLATKIIKRNLDNSKWYTSTTTEDSYSYYDFKKGRVTHRAGNNRNNIVTHAVGDYNYLDEEFSQFNYKWDSTAGNPTEDEILVIDNNILILANGFQISTTKNSHFNVKDFTLFTQNVPFMGIGNFKNNDYSEWIAFSPDGTCYKRYTDLSDAKKHIIEGTWEKTADKEFKITWSNVNNNYDILKNNLLYQNVKNNQSVIPITLYVNN